jgi:hypothetical protein
MNRLNWQGCAMATSAGCGDRRDEVREFALTIDRR